MINVIENLGENVIGFALSGVVTGADYENVLIPAIEEKLKTNEKVRVLYHVTEEFDSYEFQAMLDDAKAGLRFFTHWERIAVVSDIAWIVNGVKIFSFGMPGEIKTFSNAQLDEARAWLLS